MPRALTLALPLALALLVAGRASAQICTAATSGLAFGRYDPFAAAATAVTGTVTVTCRATVAAGVSYAVQLGTGTGGSFAARSLSSGTSRLGYQLYTGSGLTQVWGDGSGGTGVVGDAYVLAALATASRTYTAYGRIPPRQAVAPGTYGDQIVVLVVY